MVWLPPDTGTSAHDNYFDNSDGGWDCCQAVFAAHIYRNYFNGWDNDVYNPVNPSTGETLFLMHDNTIYQNVRTFGSNGIHPNCVHLFGNNSSYTEIIYNNWINCAEKGTSEPNTGESETLEVEEDYATTYIFNNILSSESQPNGINIGDFSGTGKGGTLYIFQNTHECGFDPNSPWGGITNQDPGFSCLVFKNDNNGNPSTGSAHEYNDLGISNGYYGRGAVFFPSSNSWTFTSAPNPSKTCEGVTTTDFGGTLICNPIGDGDGTGNININETYPFAPLDATAAATVGTASATTLRSLCATISGINAAAGTACLSDTTVGVTPNVSNHTVALTRTPVVRPTSGNWQIGAYESTNSDAPQSPTGLSAVVQ
jgi:hypothetical protein